jgi:signal transduction histidine kinase
VDVLREVMRKSLGEIRTQIHQISPSEEREEVPSQLKKIADEFALHTKTNIHFEHIDQHDINISSQATITLIRCLQESLTNAIRHGHANEIMITLKADSSHVILLIQDNGIGSREVSYGFGLTGMKESLESLQGRLSIESKENEGTVVTCFLPVIVSRFREEVMQDDKSVTSG